MKIPDFISDYGGCGCCSNIGTGEMERLLTEWVQSREHRAFERARKVTLSEQDEDVPGHLVEGLKFVHPDFDEYLNSKDYEP